MTTGTLDAAIAEALEAQEQLEAQQRIEAQAAQLDALLAEKELKQELTEAEASLANVKQWAKRELSEAAQQATDWRGRFAAACSELEALAAELGPLQKCIYGAGRELHRAAQAVNSVGYEPTPVTTGSFDPGTSYTLRMGRGVSFSQLLAEVGGHDHRLSVWPQPSGDGRAEAASMRQALRKLLRERTRTVTYAPHLGAKQF